MTQTMTCTECLSLVATADMTELTTAGVVRDHCRTCADCARVVDEVAEEAGRLADLLDGTLPGVPANVVALRAVAGSAPGRRRARQRRTALLLGAVAVAPLVALFVSRTVVPAPAVVTRTVALQCLTPMQAAQLTRPLLPLPTKVTVRPSLGLPVLTLQGVARDVAAAEQVIELVDARWRAERSAHCTTAPGDDAPPAPPDPLPARVDARAP